MKLAMTILGLLFTFSTMVHADTPKELINSIGLREYQCFYHIETLPSTLVADKVLFAESEKDAMKLLLLKIGAFSAETPNLYVKGSDINGSLMSGERSNGAKIDRLNCKPYGSQ